MDEKVEKQDNLKTQKYILFGIVALQILVLATTMLILRNRGSGTERGNNTSTFPFWLIVLIPIIAARRKGKDSKKTKEFMWLVVGLAVLVLFAMLFFLWRAVV